MKTLKEFLLVGLLGVAILVPATVVVSLLYYSVINNAGYLNLGKFRTGWTEIYLSATVTYLLYLSAKYVMTYRKLKRYANAIDIPLNYVEEAWWDLKYWDTHKKDMFCWDQRRFMEMLAADRAAKQSE